MKRILYLTVVATLMLFTSACQKDADSSNGNARVEIKMTDAPGNFDAINLHVKEIILMSEDEEPYIFTVDVPAFNILDYRLGSSQPDILVASGEMPSGNISEIRLVLHDDNTIIIDGEESPLTTPSAQSSGFKVKMTELPELLPGANYTLLLDFDAAKSIVRTGNGKYILKPVVRGIAQATTGLISGTVLPLESHPEILVINGADTVGTVADAETGMFTVGGLAGGSYKVQINPLEGFRDSTIVDVQVQNGAVTSLGTVTLSSE